MKPLLIGLLGRSRSGKDTVAQIIQNLYPDIYGISRFSQPIKNALRELYDFTDNQLEGPQKEEIDLRYDITPRSAMQNMTTTYFKLHGDHFFSDRLFNRYERIYKPFGKGIIIPDVRYVHDINQIHKKKGIVIKVIRNNLNILHDSENHIDNLDADYLIYNNSTLDELKNNIVATFNELN